MQMNNTFRPQSGQNCAIKLLPSAMLRPRAHALTGTHQSQWNMA